ncbi:hypothetical protein [Leptospira santarosai]|uniref:hypothetical protein n=2 Tax=Leptospira santarosai TaxID=28183 RepID=UPI00063B3767|nr:hypothetical protein [Leptospira santarosai]AVV49575.1 Uncharacterized protein XB17_00974 [Leptospira santarosai]AVV80035.1 Uncharacterized protein XB15_02284 [Leptospira santarosai]MDI7172353.1 hypothetical protein [Leptospira santarosai]MDI7194434.1 hypothetical protein [Leptospira santarosai]MDO6396406.1 hypothetical protein [Leptospira santarosai]
MESSDRYPFKVPPKTSRIFTLLRVLIRNLLVLGQVLDKTCHRRFKRNGTMRKMIRSLATDPRERGEIDIEEFFIDGTYDRDGLDKSILRNYGTKVVAPHRKNKKQTTQDGRELRHYKRRWKMERLFA